MAKSGTGPVLDGIHTALRTSAERLLRSVIKEHPGGVLEIGQPT